MDKTPEQMADEYGATPHEKDAFLAGYQAGSLNSEAVQAVKELYAAKLKEANETLAGMEDECEGLKSIIYDHDETNLLTPAKWISVKERLPEEGKLVLTYGPDGIIDVLTRYKASKNSWKWGRDGEFITLVFDITHWMPLPEPPKEEK